MYLVRCAIWYHLYNLKNVKKTHGGVLILVELQAAILLKLTLLHGCFSRFLNCANGTKSCNAQHIAKLESALLLISPFPKKRFHRGKNGHIYYEPSQHLLVQS